MAKVRLDQHIQNIFPHYSRTQLQSWIVQGKVLVDGFPITKPGASVSIDSVVELLAIPPKYVGRGGIKLERALEYFNLNVMGLTALDSGLSTGGFSDCLLQHGAAKVYGVDVGYGQVHEKLRQDPRLIVIERTNFRMYKHEGDPIDLVTLDLSFISLLKIMETVNKLLDKERHLVTLIKPQFEAEKGQVPEGGVIKDSVQRDAIVKRVIEGVVQQGYLCLGFTPSPITGADGNVEYLACFIKN